MRDDMDRVLIERPRWGHAMPNDDVRHGRVAVRQARAHGRLDELPTSAPMRPRRGPRKELTDFLAPLRRLLRSRRGRAWDDVYAEVREHLSPTSALHMHVLHHLDQMVERHATVDDDGRVLGSRRAYLAHELFQTGRTFYVDPTTGRLHEPIRRPPRQRRARRLPYVADRVERDGRTWVRLGGERAGWHEVTLARGDDGHDALFDAPAAQVPEHSRLAAYGDARAFAVRRRRVSRKRRRALGLP